MKALGYLLALALLVAVGLAAGRHETVVTFAVLGALTWPLWRLLAPRLAAADPRLSALAPALVVYALFALFPDDLYAALVVRPLCGGSLCSEGTFYGTLLRPLEYFNFSQANTAEEIAVRLLWLGSALFSLAMLVGAWRQRLRGMGALAFWASAETVKSLVFLVLVLAATRFQLPFNVYTYEASPFGVVANLGVAYAVAVGAAALWRRAAGRGAA